MYENKELETNVDDVVKTEDEVMEEIKEDMEELKALEEQAEPKKETIKPENKEEKPKPKVGRKKLDEEDVVNNDTIIEEIENDKVINKTHVAYLKYKKGENCWLAVFTGQAETSGSIFNKLENKYKFRPKYVQIKNVMINEYLQPLYEFDSITGYHTEDKLFDNEKDCQAYCDTL